MSRTYKTDPYWVQAMRDGYISHDHHYYGIYHRLKTIRKMVPKTDADGSPCYTTTEKTIISGYNVTGIHKRNMEENFSTFINNDKQGKIELKKLRSENFIIITTAEYKTELVKVPQYELVTVGNYAAPEHCSDELVRKEYSQHFSSARKTGENIPICSPQLHSYKYKKSFIRTSRSYRKNGHSGNRKKASSNLRNVSKEYNSSRSCGNNWDSLTIK